MIGCSVSAVCASERGVDGFRERSHIVEIPGAGRYLSEERPQELTELLLDFVV